MIYGIFWEEISLLSEYIHPPLGKSKWSILFPLGLVEAVACRTKLHAGSHRHAVGLYLNCQGILREL